MQFKEKDRFLDELVSQVKFSFDRADIRKELEDHILDSMEYYIEKGYDEDKAENMAVQDMGDAREIGKALNKEHNPVIGWLWKISNVLVGLFIGASILVGFVPMLFGLFSVDPYRYMEKDNIVYEIDVEQKVQIDDVVIKFTKLVYDNEGDMNIYYRYYDKKLWGIGWSNESLGEIYDDKGNKYFNGGGHSSNGIISKSMRSIRDFPSDAMELIIVYDGLNRYYEVRIPLEEGVSNE